MKIMGRIFLILFVLLAAAAGAAYSAFNMQAEQYEDRFIEGTFINDMNVGNMTAAEVEAVIRDRVENYSLDLIFEGNVRETLSMEDIGFAYESDNKVVEILSSQNKNDWIRAKFGETSSYTVGENYIYDEEKLRSALMNLPEMKEENQTQPTDAHMAMGEDHRLTIIPETDGNAIDPEPVYEALKKAVEEGQREVDVTSLGVYSHAKVRADDEALNLQVNDLNTYLDVVVTYKLYDGSEKVLDKDTTYKWLSVKEDDPDYYYFNVDVVYDKCVKYIAKLAKKYDYSYDTITFHTTLQGDKSYPVELSGHIIDQAEEAKALYQQILSRTSAEREPLYSVSTDRDGSFGGTYVEVDIEAQHVWFYQNGTCVWDSDCVSGTGTDEDRETPKGIFDIYTKETDRTLKGAPDPVTKKPSYESFVHYWMPFYEGCGLHDATWRSDFGGDIYISGGSHGCVNLPFSKAESLYGLVEVGTPVIVH